jgi:hypothetical protein
MHSVVKSRRIRINEFMETAKNIRKSPAHNWVSAGLIKMFAN